MNRVLPIYATPNMSSFVETYTSRITREFFPDRTPNIFIEGITAINEAPEMVNVVYFTQYEDMEQKKVEEIIIHVLADTRNVRSLTVVDLFDPLATMERVPGGPQGEGTIATANVDAHFWKNLPIPDGGLKIRRILFDHHTLHNRFYYSGGNTSIIFLSAMPLLHATLDPTRDIIAFPDDGAHKRFGPFFKSYGYDIIVCGKVRDGNDRKVTVMDTEGNIGAFGTNITRTVTIVDDLVRSGGTLKACATAICAYMDGNVGAVNVFVTHAQFTNDAWKSFLDFKDIDLFITTNTIPRISNILAEHPAKFKVLDVRPMLNKYIHI
jgi:hypothetical protein